MKIRRHPLNQPSGLAHVVCSVSSERSVKMDQLDDLALARVQTVHVPPRANSGALDDNGALKALSRRVRRRPYRYHKCIFK